MKLKSIIFTLFTLFFIACAEDNDVSVARNLQEYIDEIPNKEIGEVVACAANADANTDLAYIFYYPEEGATDIRYYEATDVNVDPNVFSNYRRQALDVQDVFGGKLQRFVRSGSEENWCLVTYVIDGKLHKSNPIRLKNTSKTTVYQDKVTIDYTTNVTPKFSWTANAVGDNDIYFQVISKTEDNQFFSGSYTYDNFFQYYDTANFVFDINEDEIPPTLEIDTEYLFTLMDVSEDNWVNLVIEQKFIPGNLQEFLDKNEVVSTPEITAFAASANGDDDLTYVYYYPLTNARDFRFYETVDANTDKDVLANYRRKIFTDDTAFGAKFRRFSRTNEEDSWGIVTYEIDGKIYTSKPIHIKISSQPTQHETLFEIDRTVPLRPIFTWSDFMLNNEQYFNVITDNSNVFLSGVFTKQTSFQYYDITNTETNINTTTPPDFILDNQYNFILFGLNSDNWVNLMIEKSFVIE